MDYLLQTIDVRILTLGRALTLMGCSVGFSAAIVLVYLISRRREGFRTSVVSTILLMGPVVTLIVVSVSNNIARAISIGGLTLVRFRNTMEDPRDLIYLFLSLAAGMACGSGYLGFGAVSLGVLLLLLLLLPLLGLDRLGSRAQRLRILVPESLNYTDAFDPVLRKYCRFARLNRIKTEDYGTLLELDYRVALRRREDEKAFLDELRERNGNLNITLVRTPAGDL